MEAPDSVKVVVWDRYPLFTPKNFYASIAQLVEQRIENPCVGGSTPSLGTKLFLRSSKVEQSADNR